MARKIVEIYLSTEKVAEHVLKYALFRENERNALQSYRGRRISWTKGNLLASTALFSFSDWSKTLMETKAYELFLTVSSVFISHHFVSLLASGGVGWGSKNRA